MSQGTCCAQNHRHKSTGTGAQTWEDRARGYKRTGAQRHRGTGTGLRTRIEDWASRFLLPRGQRDAVRGCGSLRCVLGSSLGISQALKNRAENMCPSEYVASHDNALTLRSVCLFLCRRWMSTVKAVRKKNNMQRSALVHRAHVCEFCSRT